MMAGGGGCACCCRYENNEHYDTTSPDESLEHDTWSKCCDGWNGTQCDICYDVHVCPPRRFGGGEPLAAINCTHSLLLPTIEEAEHGEFSSWSRGEAEARRCAASYSSLALAPLGVTRRRRCRQPSWKTDVGPLPPGVVCRCVRACVRAHRHTPYHHPPRRRAAPPPPRRASLPGKRFSCQCGGGADKLAETACQQQPDTSLEMTLTGLATPDSPGTFEVRAGWAVVVVGARW